MANKLRAALFFILLVAAFSAQAEAVAPDARYQLITRAESVRSTPDVVRPPHSGDWEPLEMPDSWNKRYPGYGGHAWYRMPLYDVALGTGKLGVLLPRLDMNAEVWVNDRLIGDGGSMDDPVARNWHRPLYFVFTERALKPSDNWLYIRVYAYPNDGGGIGSVYFGRDEAVRPLYEQAYFVDTTLSVAALAMTLIVTLVLLTLWLLRKGESLYGWMCASGVFWSIVIANQLLLYPPLWMSRYVWEWLVQSSISFYTLALLMVVHRFVAVPRPRIEAVAAVYFISTSIINLVFAGDMIVTWFNITHIGAIAAGFYLIAFCARRFWLERQGRALGMAIAIACCLVIGIHDWLAIVTGSQLGTLLVMQFGPPLVLLLLGLWMTLQFSKVLDSEERRRQLIEQQIGEVSLELSAEHAKRMELERKNIILAERQNFSRELHDGMGGHLMALKSMLSNDGRKDEGILKALDQAIVDMRLLVDAIGEDNNDVGMIIGMVRSRIEPQVAHTPLKIKWKLGELPMECRLKTGFGLHLARIMQEAITNVVRHAAANTLIVSAFCRDEGKRACIEIRDNGCGMPEAPRAGRGLSNIRTRAAELGGNVEIESAPGKGTAILVCMPVEYGQFGVSV
ncbi:MAG: hypothetical protein IPM27_10695 [Nitrosomonadales bacterium]|nr:hypothetical protein [Nitrosomonadales bacterium]